MPEEALTDRPARVLEEWKVQEDFSREYIESEKINNEEVIGWRDNGDRRYLNKANIYEERTVLPGMNI